MKILYLPNDSQLLSKSILRQFKSTLANLDIENDFIEISTKLNGVQIQVRIFGQPDPTGNLNWHVTRIINQSIIPTVPNGTLAEKTK
jgi:hypothetical protein